MLRGAALQHKKMFAALLAGAGVDVVVRQPVAPVAASTSADKVLGRQVDQAPDAVGTTQTVRVVWSTSYRANPATGAPDLPPSLAAVGRTERLDVVLRCALADVVIDPNTRHGKTIFDTAKDVQFDGATYQVKGTDRTGLPPEGPYILWVGLRKVGE